MDGGGCGRGSRRPWLLWPRCDCLSSSRNRTCLVVDVQEASPSSVLIFLSLLLQARREIPINKSPPGALFIFFLLSATLNTSSILRLRRRYTAASYFCINPVMLLTLSHPPAVALGFVLLACLQVIQVFAISPITAVGSKFFTEDGKQFFLKGEYSSHLLQSFIAVIDNPFFQGLLISSFPKTLWSTRNSVRGMWR